MTDLIGQTIGKYQIYERIGKGGFGSVYKAHSNQTDVAIKIIAPERMGDDVSLKRFELEAQIITELDHPHIVKMLEFWEDEHGAYLVMPLLTGGNLRTLLAQGVWSPERTLPLLEQIVGALNAAHLKHIVHRDIKPENILFDDKGTALLVDFGFAKRLDGPEKLTGQYGFVGSPAYLAPEQLLNQPVTPYIDIYSLGIVLYEILVGEHPYPDTPSELMMMMKHLREPLPALHEKNPALTPAINAVVQKAVAKNVPDRYADVLTLFTEFKKAVHV